jgi:hypothetical protein
MRTSDLIIGALAFLGLAKSASAASSSTSTGPKPTKKAAQAADALDRASKLQARANQDAAKKWIPDLIAAGASPYLAAALSRWIGIESSGNPSKPSKAGEYGLLQILPSTAKEALTPGEWLQLKDPTTSRADQAKIAIKQFMWHQSKAKKYVKKWPGNDAGASVFYAKMHHTRPADLKAVKLTGDASADQRALVAKFKNDPAALLRLASASVVTWGTVMPP